jgi:hypothetical protein
VSAKTVYDAGVGPELTLYAGDLADGGVVQDGPRARPADDSFHLDFISIL